MCLRTGEDNNLALMKKVTVEDVFGPDLHIHDPEAKWLSGELNGICQDWQTSVDLLRVLQIGDPKLSPRCECVNAVNALITFELFY